MLSACARIYECGAECRRVSVNWSSFCKSSTLGRTSHDRMIRIPNLLPQASGADVFCSQASWFLVEVWLWLCIVRISVIHIWRYPNLSPEPRCYLSRAAAAALIDNSLHVVG